MSWLGNLNYYVLQWFFIRLAKEVDEKTDETIRWTILWGVVPLSGWDSRPYKWVCRK